MKRFNQIKILLAILIVAATLRLYGLDWDQGQHLHPDERFLTMVTNTITWPHTLQQYFDTNSSPLNPHNQGFEFFVYGTFPVFFTKIIAETLNLGDYLHLTLVGRALSALFDLGTIFLIYLIGKKIFSPKVGLLAAFLYSISVLPIQLSHFFAVDTYLTFFIVLSFYFLIRILEKASITLFSILGLLIGLAMASKISALYFIPVILLGIILAAFRQKHFLPIFIMTIFFVLSMYITLRLTNPYLFSDPSLTNITLNPKVLDNWKQLKSFDDPNSSFPPGIQWITTKPYIFPLKNMIFYGLGSPLGILSVAAFIIQIYRITSTGFQKRATALNDIKFISLSLMVVWILLLFTYQGGQFVKAMRYFYPIYPFLSIVTALFISQTYTFLRRKFIPFQFYILYSIFYILLLIWPLAFISVYTKPHTRVSASEWIYQNIPYGSKISMEHWDDPLPLNLPRNQANNYTGVEFLLYNPDSDEKWSQMQAKIKEVDYIILSSNRLYGSLMTIPKRYPQTYQYYEALFNGSLGFKKMTEITSRPNIPLPFIKICLTPPFTRYGIIAQNVQECSQKGLTIVDDYADETFTVYDHPKVIIFSKEQKILQTPSLKQQVY